MSSSKRKGYPDRKVVGGCYTRQINNMALAQKEIETLIASKPENCGSPERFPLIGLVGPVGAGKTTLGKLLEQNWNTPDYPVSVHEERFGDNPFLVPWYADPAGDGLSFKSQLFFLEDKAKQLGDLESCLSQSAQIIDTAPEMDFIIALTHREMGWMKPEEFDLYKDMFFVFREQGKLMKPDITIVVNAEPDHVRDRVTRRGRPFELSMVRNHPEYFDIMHGFIEDFFGKAQGTKSILRIDSGRMDYISSPQGKSDAIDEIGNWVGYHSRMRPEFFKNGDTQIILPKFV